MSSIPRRRLVLLEPGRFGRRRRSLKLIVPNDYLDFHNTMRHQAKKQVGVIVFDSDNYGPAPTG
jgi:hypothetical protein